MKVFYPTPLTRYKVANRKTQNGHLAFFHIFQLSYLKIVFTGDILSKNEGEFA